jgi:hypothetical protein
MFLRELMIAEPAALPKGRGLANQLDAKRKARWHLDLRAFKEMPVENPSSCCSL